MLEFDHFPGQGPALVCLHGLGVDKESWYPNLPSLRCLGSVYLVNLPAYGASPEVKEWTLSEMAAAVHRFVSETIHETSVYLIGHSMGAWVSLEICKIDPRIYAGLLLVAPAGFETFTEKEKTLLLSNLSLEYYEHLTANQVREAVMMNFFYPQNQTAEALVNEYLKIHADSLQRSKYARIRVKGIQAMLTHPLGPYPQKVPVKVLFAQEDRLIPHPIIHDDWNQDQIIEECLVQLPQAQIEVIPNAGHFLHYDQPEAFVYHLSQLLKSTL